MPAKKRRISEGETFDSGGHDAAIALRTPPPKEEAATAEKEAPVRPDSSYIELIARAILECPTGRLRLQDIYDSISERHSYFRTAESGWRNSVRHNLSLHQCFTKAGRCESGKGHYWTIHPANLQDFQRGDYRRRVIKSRLLNHHEESFPDGAPPTKKPYQPLPVQKPHPPSYVPLHYIPFFYSLPLQHFYPTVLGRQPSSRLAVASPQANSVCTAHDDEVVSSQTTSKTLSFSIENILST